MTGGLERLGPTKLDGCDRLVHPFGHRCESVFSICVASLAVARDARCIGHGHVH